MIGAGVRREAMACVRERYWDFGPTLACEKLADVHGHRLSVEALHQWMIAEGLWKVKSRCWPTIISFNAYIPHHPLTTT